VKNEKKGLFFGGPGPLPRREGVHPFFCPTRGNAGKKRGPRHSFWKRKKGTVSATPFNTKKEKKGEELKYID